MAPEQVGSESRNRRRVDFQLWQLTNEEHRQCCEMAKIMLKVAIPLDTILNTVNAKDQHPLARGSLKPSTKPSVHTNTREVTYVVSLSLSKIGVLMFLKGLASSPLSRDISFLFYQIKPRNPPPPSSLIIPPQLEGSL
ncbi:hypothetical protein JHK84_043083 [Glycine max]|nr:hypothetical protein JHK84_043083 [Glycine max]